MNEGLSTEDSRDIIRLLGDIAVREDGLMAQKQFLMEGLAVLIEADSWAWATTFRFQPEEVPLNSGFLTAGFNPEQSAKFQQALEHPDTATLNASFTTEFEQKQTHLTRLLDQMDVEGRFRQTAVYPIWIAAGVEQVILSIRPSTSGALSQIGVYRRPGRSPFTPRESASPTSSLAKSPGCTKPSCPPASAPPSPASRPASASSSTSCSTANPAARSPPTSASPRTPSMAT